MSESKVLVKSKSVSSGRNGADIFEWSFFGPSSGEPVSTLGFKSMSVQVDFDLGSDGSIIIEGSNNGVNFYPIKDKYGNYLEIDVRGLYQVDIDYAFVRPSIKLINDDGSSEKIVIIYGKAL